MDTHQLALRLRQGRTVTVRDALWKDIRLDSSLARILGTPQVQKLGRIRQLGPAALVYPCAVHTRLSHSLGVYHLSSLIIDTLLEKGSGTLFTEKGVRSFLAATLLHDIGHFPYAHSLKELPLKSHERLACEAIVGGGGLSEAIRAGGLDPKTVGLIIDDSQPSGDPEIACYRRLLSGTLDPDKLDYLNRDAFFCGVPYGSQDASYITSHLAIAGGMPALEASAAGSVEHLLFAKYLMYRNVYWHRGTRSATAMIKKALLTLLSDGAIRGEQLYGLDDASFFALRSRVRHPALALFDAVEDNRLFKPVFEEPWDGTRDLDRRAATLEGRTRVEEEIWKDLRKRHRTIEKWEVVVDIPEPVSFEADMPLLRPDGSTVPFGEADQVMHSDIGKVFTHALRKTRVYVPACIAEEENTVAGKSGTE